MTPNLEQAGVYLGWTAPGPTTRSVVLNHCTVLVYALGHKRLHAVVLDGSVKLVTWPLEEQRHMRPLLYKGKPYPIARAVRMLKRAGATMGITDGARQALDQIKEQAHA